MNSPQDSWFNPTIYFACKLCRQSTRNVDELILHKRLTHTADELREIKCIIFEERFLKAESEDALLDSKDFIKDDVSLSNSNAIISQLPKCKSNAADYVNVGGVKNNINSQLTNSTDLKNPYIFLKRLSTKEISSFSKRAPYKNKEDLRANFTNTKNSVIPHVNVSSNLKFKPRPESDSIINEGNKNRRNSKSCIQTYTAVPAPDLNDAQISRLIHNEEIVQLSVPCIRIERLPVPLSNQLKSNGDRIRERGSAGSSHSIGTKRNSQPVFSQNSKIKAKPPKRCKITRNDDETFRKDSEDENSDNCSDANEIQSSIQIVSSSASLPLSSSSIGEHSHDETPSPLYIAELDKTTLFEKENQHYDDDLSDDDDCPDFHEDLIGDNEGDSSVIMDLKLDKNNYEPLNAEPIHTDEDPSPTKIPNLHETVNEICCVLNPQEQEQLTKDLSSTNITGNEENVAENNDDCTVLQPHSIHEISNCVDTDICSAKSTEEGPVITSVLHTEPTPCPELSALDDFNESSQENQASPLHQININLDSQENPLNSPPPPQQSEVPSATQHNTRCCTRTRRNVSKVNYSENQSCLVCNTDFYTVEDLENHEKKCALLKSSGTTSLNSKSVPCSGDKQASENDEIQIIKSESQKVNPVQDPVNDDDYNSEASSSNNSSDSESDDQNDDVIDNTLTTDYNYLQRKNNAAIMQKRSKLNKPHLPSPPIVLTEADLQLPLVKWLQNEKLSYNNVILLDPDPTKATGQKIAAPTNSDAEIVQPAESDFESLLYPITCKLCSLNLNSGTDVKNHVRFCWTFNKPNHLYCIRCRLSFSFLHSFNRHIEFKHRNYVSSTATTWQDENDEAVRSNSESESEDLDFNTVDSSSCCESVSDGESDSKPMYDEEPVFFRDLKQLSFTEWLKKQAQENSENIIRLDPDPLSPDSGSGPGAREKTNANAADFIIGPQNPIKCNLCSHKLNSDFDARSHIETCWRYNKKSHTFCIKCEKSLSNHSSLQQHNKTKHRKPGDALPAPIKCDVCNKEFSLQSTLKGHKKNHHSGTPILKNFICEICRSAFRNSSNLQRHKLSHVEGRSFKCTVCSKAFKGKPQLERHKNIHSEKIQCTLCFKPFITNWNLKKHMRTHTGELPFGCSAPNCNLKFANKQSLGVHCAKNHEEMGFKKFPCTVCPKSFLSKHRLALHMLRHSEKKFKCPEVGCNKAFIKESILREHLRCHTGETPFQCETCGKAYSRLWSFHKHIRVHTDSHNKFSCDKCPRKFPGSWELKQHLLIHEKGKQFKCDTCGFKCMTKANLKGHLKVHEGPPRKRKRCRKNTKPESEESEPETDTDTDTDKEKESEEEEIEAEDKDTDDTESDSDAGPEAGSSNDPETEKTESDSVPVQNSDDKTASSSEVENTAAVTSTTTSRRSGTGSADKILTARVTRANAAKLKTQSQHPAQ